MVVVGEWARVTTFLNRIFLDQILIRHLIVVKEKRLYTDLGNLMMVQVELHRSVFRNSALRNLTILLME